MRDRRKTLNGCLTRSQLTIERDEDVCILHEIKVELMGYGKEALARLKKCLSGASEAQ